ALNRARDQARALVCMSNLRQLSLGLIAYSVVNHGCVVPAYNVPPLPGATTNYTCLGPAQAMDGWASILDRDGFIRANAQSTNSAFYCPQTLDIDAMAQGSTGTSTGKSSGWIQWPMEFP